MNSPAKRLLRRKYEASDQDLFARLSGDSNPLHVDAVAARRTILGAPAVHGVHLALTALEALLVCRKKMGLPESFVTALSAKFPKPVLVGEAAEFHLEESGAEAARIVGRVEDEVAFTISAEFKSRKAAHRVTPLPAAPSEPLVEADLPELLNAEGELILGLDEPMAHHHFPEASLALGSLGMAEILALTRLVGMRCPGLHSLFSQIDVRFEGSGSGDALHYRVANADARFRRLKIEVSGPSLSGALLAFVRPLPAPQPSMAEVARAVPAGAYGGHRALIVGGSRGLGELTAKIIAAGGGEAVISYFQGAADAERVASEITAGGGRCEIVRLDVRRPAGALRRLFSGKRAPGSLYFFATPKISGQRRGFFEHGMLAEFNEYYVSAFGRLLDAALAVSSARLRVLYPSSIFVTEGPREMIEYAISKRAGEELCAFYNRYSGKVEITVERLPRMKTDQTMTLLPSQAEDALAVMAPIVQRVEQVT